MRSALRGVCARSFGETSRPFPPTSPVKQPLDRPAGVGMFRTWLRPPVVYGVRSDHSSRQSIPSLLGKERPGCVAFILAAPPGRCVSDEPARRSHRAFAPRFEMARILLEVSGNTGRPHPRLLFRESCERAVTSPYQYGSGTQRASDYGDLIKGALECQPMPLRRPRPGEDWCAS